MSWRLLRSCAIILWLMAACMFVVSVLAGFSSTSYIMPVVLAAGTSIGGWLFWRLANERQALMRGVKTALQKEGIPADLADGLTKGELTEEQFQQLCDWTLDEAKKQEAGWV